MLSRFFFKKKLFNKKSSYNKKLIYHRVEKKKKLFINEFTGMEKKFIWTPIKLVSKSLVLLTNIVGEVVIYNKQKLPLTSLFSDNFFYQKFYNILPLSLSFMSLTPKLIFKSFIINNLKYSQAFNSFSVVLSKSKTKVVVILPSNKQIYFLYNSNIFINNCNNVTYKSVKKVIVRGIAKNPVDHPNGGNSNIKKPFKTP